MPGTNILWVHYLCRKLLTAIKYAHTGRGYRDAERKLRQLDRCIPKYASCAEIACDDSVWA